MKSSNFWEGGILASWKWTQGRKCGLPSFSRGGGWTWTRVFLVSLEMKSGKKVRGLFCSGRSWRLPSNPWHNPSCHKQTLCPISPKCQKLLNWLYRSDTVNSKSFVDKVLLRIKWKFELTVHFKHQIIGKHFTETSQKIWIKWNFELIKFELTVSDL